MNRNKHSSGPESGQPADARARDGADAAPGATQTQEIELSEEAAELVRQLQTERDEALEGRLRALADFRNYQRRALESEQRALESGAARVVRALIPIVDNFDLTLGQNPAQMNVQQLMSAVKMVREELTKALQAQGVERIEPGRGEVFDPHKHEAVMRQPADDIEPNSVVMTLQPGYAMGDLVLRPAKVALSPSAEEE